MFAMSLQKRVLLETALLTSSIALATGFALAAQKAKKPAPPQAPELTTTSAPGVDPSASTSASEWHAREGSFFKRTWGVDVIGVHPVASGFMLRFSYRVLDPKKAKILNDKKQDAYLVEESTGSRLTVPTMDYAGLLRTVNTPKYNNVYWMLFGNSGTAIKPGDHVTVVVGDFRATGLVVE
jgi:hypothetical protein